MTLTSFADIDSAFPPAPPCHPIEFELRLLGAPALRHIVISNPLDGALSITQWTGDTLTGHLTLPGLHVESFLDEVAEARHTAREVIRSLSAPTTKPMDVHYVQ